jgi:nicotinamidase-related amidase
MDYQPAILANFADAADLLAHTALAISTARAAGTRLVYVRVAFTAQDYAAIPRHNKTFAGLSGGGYLLDGTPEADIHPDVAPQDGDVIVTKTRYGAFSTTNLSGFLNPREIDNLVLVGIFTSGVVLTTLREAADRDYRLFVLTDCCGDPHPEVHRVLIDNVFPAQAELITTETWPALLGA